MPESAGLIPATFGSGGVLMRAGSGRRAFPATASRTPSCARDVLRSSVRLDDAQSVLVFRERQAETGEVGENLAEKGQWPGQRTVH
jgi:hypothetical protein